MNKLTQFIHSPQHISLEMTCWSLSSFHHYQISLSWHFVTLQCKVEFPNLFFPLFLLHYFLNIHLSFGGNWPRNIFNRKRCLLWSPITRKWEIFPELKQTHNLDWCRMKLFLKLNIELSKFASYPILCTQITNFLSTYSTIFPGSHVTNFFQIESTLNLIP